MASRATLDGIPLLNTSPVKWTLREGVLPNVEEFDMVPEDALKLREKHGPLTLRIEPDGQEPLEVRHLWVLDIIPGTEPYISRVRVADRRWIWAYGHLLRRYNIRKNTGVKRILANDKFPDDFGTDRAFDVGYWKWSLYKGKDKWVALRMVQDALQRVSDIEKEFRGEGFEAVIDERIGSKIRGLPIENIDIDDVANAGMRRVIAVLPEAGIYVNYEGKIIVYSKAAGDEDGAVKALMPEIRDMGHTDLVENELIRPRKIRVLFTREIELRHDFIEVTSAAGATTTADLGDQLVMENVMAITDYQLTVNGRTLPQDTWITVDEGFRSFGNLPLLDVPLDHRIVQEAFIPQMDLWTAIGMAGIAADSNGDLAPWAGRISELRNRYRQTFRINPNIIDRTLSYRAYRVGTINPERGTRAPSRLYGDYCILYTQRSNFRNAQKNLGPVYCNNKTAFSGGNLDSTVEPSPAIVRIMDHDQGIIHCEYRGTDPLSGDTRTILPSQMVADSIPRADARDKSKNIGWDMILDQQNPPRLSPAFKAATILSHIPASPNTRQQLHAVEISAEEVESLLPEGARRGLRKARGPVMEIRIGANLEVARIPWNDASKNDILKAFGILEGEPNLDRLVINENGSTDLRTGGSLNLIALAAAARLYASMTDRYEGYMHGAMNPNVVLAGWTGELTHTLHPDGMATTGIVFLDRIEKMDMFSFLDGNTRAAVLRLVQPDS